MFNCSARLFSSATDFCFSSAISTAATPDMVGRPGTGGLGGCVTVHYRERSGDVSGVVNAGFWSVVSGMTRRPEERGGKNGGTYGECAAEVEARPRGERRQGAS